MNDTISYNSSIGQLIEPESITYSFDTTGWYLVFGLIVVIVFVILSHRYRKYVKNRYRRAAIEEIQLLVQQKDTNLVFKINTILKSLAIQLFGRNKVAAIYGDEWFRFLSNKLLLPPDFVEENIGDLTKALYNSEYRLNEKTSNGFVEFAIFWIKNHRVNV